MAFAAGKKVYIQASLHADEVPAMLVAQFLRRELERLEAEGRIAARSCWCRPRIRSACRSHPRRAFGRFDLATGVNFNRAYKHVAAELKESLKGKLGPDARPTWP
jgi:predicted deacylase